MSEKPAYRPGAFTVERHVRGKWVCKRREHIVQAPAPAHVIDKGIPTVGLLAHLLVAKFIDHLPLDRRKSSLHVGSDMGGQIAAVMYTSLGTARLNSINPQC